MDCLLGQVAVFLGLSTLFICILSLLVIGIAAPLGVMEIDLTEEMEEFSISVDETSESLVDVLGRALRRLCSLITFAFPAFFTFLGFNLVRIVQCVSCSMTETAKLLITLLSWLVRCIYTGARNLLCHHSSGVHKPSPTAHLENEIKELRGQASISAEKIGKLYEEIYTLKNAVYAAELEAKQAKKAKERQDALVTHQQKTVKTLQQCIAGIPQEHLHLRKTNTELEEEVDALERKLEKALEARNGAEERRRKTVEEADSTVGNAQNLQLLAEVERDQAESYLEKAKTDCENRLKVSASQIFNLKKEIAKKSLIDPRIYSQTVEQVHTLHGERDDARDALDLVTAQLEEARGTEAAAQRLVQATSEELQRVESLNGIGGDLYSAQVELAQCKAEAQRKVEATRSESNLYWRKSVADREELRRAQNSLEEKERQHRREIFDLRMKHDGSMQTAQSKIDLLEASNEDFRARNSALDASLMRAQKKARLPRDPELQASLIRATADLQRVRNEHATELEVVRKKHTIELERVHKDHATELQNHELEVHQKCEQAYSERLAEWRAEEEKSGQQVDHWRSRAELAEENVKTLNRAAERVASEQEQTKKELTAALQQHEAEAVKRCEEAHEARLKEYRVTQEQLRGQMDELEGVALRAKEELEDLRASVSQGNQQVMAEDPAASVQIPQTLPASESGPEGMDATIDQWFRDLPPGAWDSIMDEFAEQPPAADSAVPAQTSPTSPPPEPALELQEPEPYSTTVLGLPSTPTSAPAQLPMPSAPPQPAPAPAPHDGPMFPPASPPKGMTPRGPRKAKSKPNHYTQQRREDEAAYDAELGSTLDYMFSGGPEPARGAPAPTQSVPLGIPGNSGFGKIP